MRRAPRRRGGPDDVRLGRWTTFALLFALLAGPAAADPHRYVQGGVGDAVVLCPTGAAPRTVGGVCLPAGHVGPNDDGEATITVSDLFIQPASATYCQDLNNDFVCGGLEEPSEPFCGSKVLSTPGNWDPTKAIQIHVHLALGAPALSPCGGVSPGTVGDVFH